MYFYLHVILVGFLYFTLNVSGTTIFQCEENMPLPLAVWGSGCSNLPCVLNISQLEQADFYVTFNATHDIDDGQLYLYWNGMSDDMTEVDGMNFKGLCEGLIVGKCPLFTGQMLTYYTHLFGPTTFAGFDRFDVKLMMLDGKGKPVFCFKSEVSLLDARL